MPGPPLVVQPLQETPPAGVFVDLVEYPQVGGRQLAPQDALPVAIRIPIRISRTPSRQVGRQRRLADLPRPDDEHHLATQVLGDLWRQVAFRDSHAREAATNPHRGRNHSRAIWTIVAAAGRSCGSAVVALPGSRCGGGTLRAPLPDGAARRVCTRGTFTTACQARGMPASSSPLHSRSTKTPQGRISRPSSVLLARDSRQTTARRTPG